VITGPDDGYVVDPELYITPDELSAPLVVVIVPPDVSVYVIGWPDEYVTDSLESEITVPGAYEMVPDEVYIGVPYPADMYPPPYPLPP
jgi:hypothetical protein